MCRVREQEASLNQSAMKVMMNEHEYLKTEVERLKEERQNLTETKFNESVKLNQIYSMCQLVDQTNLGRSNMCSGTTSITNMIKDTISVKDNQSSGCRTASKRYYPDSDDEDEELANALFKVTEEDD